MHSSSAACVFGDARFTSSTSRRFANTGPGLNSNSLARWSNTLTPVTSDGSRSGVNWRRENEQSSDRASAFASIVFPTPGKSSMIRCPSATRQRTTRRSASCGACTTRARFATIAATRSAGAGATAGSAKQALHLVEDRRCDLVLRRLRDRLLTAAADERHLVVGRLEADVGATDVVEDEEVCVLRRELLACALEAALSLVGGEADEHLAGDAALAERREHVGRRLELERPAASVLRALRREGLRGPVVGDGCGHDHHICLYRASERLGFELGCARRLDELDARRRGDSEIRAEKRDARAAPPRLGRERDAHASGRSVADEPDCVDRLARPAGGDEHALAA